MPPRGAKRRAVPEAAASASKDLLGLMGTKKPNKFVIDDDDDAPTVVDDDGSRALKLSKLPATLDVPVGADSAGPAPSTPSTRSALSVPASWTTESSAWDITSAGDDASDSGTHATHIDDDFEASLTQEVKDNLEREQESSASTAAPNPQDHILNMAKEALANDGSWDMRNALGQQWYKDNKPGTDMHTHYAALKGRAAKAAFRSDWLRGVVKDITEKHIHTHSYKKVDRSKGTYRSIGNLIEQYGIHYNRNKAIEAGYKYARSAAALGGQWVTYEPMAGVIEIFHLERSSMQLMEEAWAKKREADMDLSADNKKALPATTPTPRAKAKAKIAPKASPKAKQRGQSAGAKSDDDPDATKTDGIVAAKAALKLKALIHNTKGNAREVLASIDSGDSSWSWARNNENRGVLVALTEELDAAISADDFFRAYLISELKDLRVKHSSQFLLVKQQAFLELQPILDKLRSQLQKLVRAHKSMSE